VYYDLDERREEHEHEDAAIVRIEQLYPFPEHEIRSIISRYDGADEVVWCQEESENRGAFSFVRGPIGDILQESGRRLRYAGRPRTASPATGSHKEHIEELTQLLDEAFSEHEQNNEDAE
jgi:2-oxoglutarate dehydrogenase E1 component